GDKTTRGTLRVALHHQAIRWARQRHQPTGFAHLLCGNTIRRRDFRSHPQPQPPPATPRSLPPSYFYNNLTLPLHPSQAGEEYGPELPPAAEPNSERSRKQKRSKGQTTNVDGRDQSKKDIIGDVKRSLKRKRRGEAPAPDSTKRMPPTLIRGRRLRRRNENPKSQRNRRGGAATMVESGRYLVFRIAERESMHVRGRRPPHRKRPPKFLLRATLIAVQTCSHHPQPVPISVTITITAMDTPRGVKAPTGNRRSRHW
ncbi:hypothetical protein M427DRAFT_352888, partial [Gonapodya prolifera JEL478]